MKILFRILKGFLIFILTLIVGITILNIVPWTFSSVKGENMFRTKTDYPLVIPHGGAKDLVPENTVYSYEMLVNDYEVDVLEIDLALTKDEILITHHDLDLEMSNSHPLHNSLIKDSTYNEIISAYEEDDYYLARQFIDINGLRPFENITDELILEKMVPAKLEDIFIENGNNILYILEIKDSPTSSGYQEGSMRFEKAASILIDLVESYDLESNVVLGSFSDDVTNYFKVNAPNIMVGAAQNEVTNFAIYSAFFIDFFWGVKSEVLILPNPSSMKIPENLVSTVEMIPNFIRKNIAIKDGSDYRANLMNKQVINDAHRKNMAVFYWTINDEDEMRHLINIGADGIITDRPDILIQIIKELENGN